MGYAIAHPRLNPVGILPPGSRPSDVHSGDDIITFVLVALSWSMAALLRWIRWHYAFVVAMTCEACEAETQARLIARGKRSATPGCHHPPPSCIRIGCELHIILGMTAAIGPNRKYGRIQNATTYTPTSFDYAPVGDKVI